jgi:hypothetical protein
LVQSLAPKLQIAALYCNLIPKFELGLCRPSFGTGVKSGKSGFLRIVSRACARGWLEPRGRATWTDFVKAAPRGKEGGGIVTVWSACFLPCYRASSSTRTSNVRQ